MIEDLETRMAPPSEGRWDHVDGIWRCLSPDRAAYFEQFCREYEIVRESEGRRAMDTITLQKLPYGAHPAPQGPQIKCPSKFFV